MITQQAYNHSWGAVLIFLGIMLLAVSLLTNSASAIATILGLILIFGSLTIFSAAATDRRRSTLTVIGLLVFIFGILVFIAYIAPPTIPYIMGTGMLILGVGELVRGYISTHHKRRVSVVAAIISFLFAIPLFIPTINILTIVIASLGAYALILGILTLFQGSPVLRPGRPLKHQPSPTTPSF
jgi:hypothetical protein